MGANTRLSVNVNKVALLRNARGGDVPNVLQVAKDCARFGAQGITVHPRPDGRHIRWADVAELKQQLSVELNVEGYPTEEFLGQVLSIRPAQVTLVPDGPTVLTSSEGWDTISYQNFLQEVITQLAAAGIRTSLFVAPDASMVIAAKATGAQRVELYTGPYAQQYTLNPEMALQPYLPAGQAAAAVGLGLNAGHDLSLVNLTHFARHVPNLLEVSIGHALIADALYLGFQATIEQYLACLNYKSI